MKKVYYFYVTERYVNVHIFKCGCEIELESNVFVNQCYQIENEDEYHILEWYEDEDFRESDEYEIEYSEDRDEYVYTEIFHDFECMECKLRKIYTSPFKTWKVSHGLLAFNHGSGLGDIIDRMNDINEHPEWQICASSIKNNCGPIGVWGKGKIDLSFNHDMWSRVGDDYFRHVSGNWLDVWEKYINLDGETIPEELIKSLLTDRHKEGKIGHTHCEHWVTQFKPTHIWVKNWAWKKYSDKQRESIKIWAKINNLKLILVEKQGIVNKKSIPLDDVSFDEYIIK